MLNFKSSIYECLLNLNTQLEYYNLVIYFSHIQTKQYIFNF